MGCGADNVWGQRFPGFHDTIDEEMEPVSGGAFFLAWTEGMTTCARRRVNGKFGDGAMNEVV